jgi:hypothetical protein
MRPQRTSFIRKAEQRRAQFVADVFDRRRKCGARQKIGRTTAFRVTVLPLPRANPPRARPATGPFGCSFFDAGEGILPHVLPARIT